MSDSGADILKRAKKLAERRRKALLDVDESQAEKVVLVARLVGSGVSKIEAGNILGLSRQRIYRLLAPEVTAPLIEAGRVPIDDTPESVKAEAAKFMVRHRKVRDRVAACRAEAQELAVEVDGSDEVRPSEFCKVMGVDSRQYHNWLEQARGDQPATNGWGV